MNSVRYNVRSIYVWRRALEEEHARLNETLTDRMQEWETLEAEIAALPEP